MPPTVGYTYSLEKNKMKGDICNTLVLNFFYKLNINKGILISQNKDAYYRLWLVSTVEVEKVEESISG